MKYFRPKMRPYLLSKGERLVYTWKQENEEDRAFTGAAKMGWIEGTAMTILVWNRARGRDYSKLSYSAKRLLDAVIHGGNYRILRLLANTSQFKHLSEDEYNHAFDIACGAEQLSMMVWIRKQHMFWTQQVNNSLRMKIEKAYTEIAGDLKQIPFEIFSQGYLIGFTEGCKGGFSSLERESLNLDWVMHNAACANSPRMVLLTHLWGESLTKHMQWTVFYESIRVIDLMRRKNPQIVTSQRILEEAIKSGRESVINWICKNGATAEDIRGALKYMRETFDRPQLTELLQKWLRRKLS